MVAGASKTMSAADNPPKYMAVCVAKTDFGNKLSNIQQSAGEGMQDETLLWPALQQQRHSYLHLDLLRA